MIAHILLNTYEKKLEGRNIFMVPFIASFIMVMWDLAMDPFMSTMSKNWIWEEGGCCYGVSFVNYMGWFLCVFTIYILFTLYQSRYGEPSKFQAIVSAKSYWIHCTIVYALRQCFLVFKAAFVSILAINHVLARNNSE